MTKQIASWLVVAFAAVLVGCGARESRQEITEVRTVTTPAAPQPGAGPHGAEAPATPRYAFAAPNGWVEAPPTPLRMINFKVGPAQDAECYVTVLQGAAGGVEMNLNRWRDQMSAKDAALDAAAIAQLPRIKVLGHDAPLLEVAGEYRGMGDKVRAGSMLLGTVCELTGEVLFVKMIGPEAVVRAERDNFIAFCGSLAG